MTPERLGPDATRKDIRKFIEEHPEGVNFDACLFARISTERHWSGVIDPIRRISGLQALGVVRIRNLKVFPVPPIKS